MFRGNFAQVSAAGATAPQSLTVKGFSDSLTYKAPSMIADIPDIIVAFAIGQKMEHSFLYFPRNKY